MPSERADSERVQTWHSGNQAPGAELLQCQRCVLVGACPAQLCGWPLKRLGPFSADESKYVRRIWHIVLCKVVCRLKILPGASRMCAEVTWELPSLLDLKPDRLKVLSISEVVDAVGPELTAHQN